MEIEITTPETSSAFSALAVMLTYDHEQVVFCQDKSTGLKAIIAIHDTTLGPALGGTRMWNYASEQEALTDVLRLSRGMTYKSSVAGINLGGGKAVIIGDSRADKSEALFRRFGKFVDSLGGKYITAEDVGISPHDIEQVHMETDHVTGVPEYLGGSGDPSPVTAYGVYVGMKAAAKKAYGSDSLAGKKVMVQGVGSVGYYLVELLAKEGALISVSDIYEPSIKKVLTDFKASVVNVNDVYKADMDIYAPCALGATVNDVTLKELKCNIIAGAANNQLAVETIHGEALKSAGILYAPDYVINSGGIINCYWELQGYNKEAAISQTEKIFDTTTEIFNKSENENIPTYLAANKMAEERIIAIGKIKRSF
ncbi:MAG: Glu/Leu/Phe/Val dehydrogenase [Flavobacteriales bacterium]